MDKFIDNLGFFIVNYPAWRYVFIAIGVWLQSEVTVFILVYFAITKSISWYNTVLTVFSVVVITDLFLYFFGKTLRNSRKGWALHYNKIKSNKRLSLYLHYFKNNLSKILILSKFLPGTSLMILTASGWSNVKFSEFFKKYLISVLIWIIIVFGSAYGLMSWLHYLNAQKILKEVKVIFISLLIVIVLFEFLVKMIFEKILSIKEKIDKMERENNLLDDANKDSK
ncbi:MAG: hypothetical protein ACP5IC_02675 [Minisyncoccia bacterium]